ncbi:hypothetical protein NL676_034756 [Syzygium grande]|nr:hypothetical protein NL676_034756 [Syzygium grande]
MLMETSADDGSRWMLKLLENGWPLNNLQNRISTSLCSMRNRQGSAKLGGVAMQGKQQQVIAVVQQKSRL